MQSSIGDLRGNLIGCNAKYHRSSIVVQCFQIQTYRAQYHSNVDLVFARNFAKSPLSLRSLLSNTKTVRVGRSSVDSPCARHERHTKITCPSSRRCYLERGGGP